MEGYVRPVSMGEEESGTSLQPLPTAVCSLTFLWAPASRSLFIFVMSSKRRAEDNVESDAKAAKTEEQVGPSQRHANNDEVQMLSW